MAIRATAAVVVGALLVVSAAGCKKETPPADLVVASPHDRQIEEEFGIAFSAWHEAKYGRPAKIEWRDMGGTTQLTKAIKSSYQDADTSGIDVYFGGGAPDHISLAKQGCLERIDPPAGLDGIPETIGGIRQYDVDAGWYGACLSSFGILYNQILYKKMHWDPPTKWTDLAAPELLGRTTAAGPNSGSARAAYELMLQTAGDTDGDWSGGWGNLLGFWGNCESFTRGASEVPTRVKDGQAVAGTCIDFYAFKEIASSGPGVVRFVLPSDGVVFTPDPISVLKGAPNRQMAERFVEFVLSAEGQALWCLPAGSEGGPKEHTLYRQPIRKSVYTTYAGKMTKDLMDTFPQPGKFRMDRRLQAARVTHILPRLMRAAAIDNGEGLREAWARIVTKGRPADLMARFRELPADLRTLDDLYRTAARLAEAEKAGNAKTVDEITTAWRQFFRAKYKAILEAS